MVALFLTVHFARRKLQIIPLTKAGFCKNKLYGNGPWLSIPRIGNLQTDRRMLEFSVQQDIVVVVEYVVSVESVDASAVE